MSADKSLFAQVMEFVPWIRWIGIGLACALLHGCGQAPSETLQHGPFEIVASGRRVSTGTFPNTGGNPFATQEVTAFSLRWRGRAVEVPGRGNSFWRVLRLLDAPRPALLLVERDFTLVTEEGGQLRVLPLHSESASLAEAQWLDSDAGQPGAPQAWGMAKVDPTAQTGWKGGRFLLLGSRVVLDVETLERHEVEPWVPMVPGQPVTSLMREGDRARAFSPGRTQYVLAGSQYDDARGQGQVHGLLVVDLLRGSAYELRVDRHRMPFADADDMDLRWISHYFAWQRDAQGERLVPRAGAPRLPWQGRISTASGGNVEYHVERVRPTLLDALRRVALAQPGAAPAPDWLDPGRGVDGNTVRIGACLLGLSVNASGQMPGDAFSRVGIHVAQGEGSPCNEAVRRIAAAMDDELATGRHDGLVMLD